jgi:hypothetical protein
MTPDQETKLDKIHELLAGSLEKKGLVHRVEEMDIDVKNLKSYRNKDQKLKWSLAGGLVALQGIWHILTK